MSTEDAQYRPSTGSGVLGSNPSSSSSELGQPHSSVKWGNEGNILTGPWWESFPCKLREMKKGLLSLAITIILAVTFLSIVFTLWKGKWWSKTNNYTRLKNLYFIVMRSVLGLKLSQGPKETTFHGETILTLNCSPGQARTSQEISRILLLCF